MKVNWFPGHMKRAYELVKNTIKKTNIVIEIVDARAPKSTRSPLLESLIHLKSRIILLNKSDLVEKSDLNLWIAHFREKNLKALECSIYKKNMRNILIENITQDAKVRVFKNFEEKIKVLVVGIPNVGKSSIINLLKGKKSTQVANKPGLTKNIQIVKISENIFMYDMPGLLWHNIEDFNVGVNLSILGSINENILDRENLALKLFEILKERGKALQEKTPLELLNDFARERGFIKKGGILNLERAAITLLKEFRLGKLGKITLEEINK